LFPLFFLKKKRYYLSVRAFRLNQFGSDNFFYVYNNLYALSGKHRIKNINFIFNNVSNLHIKLDFKTLPVLFDYNFFFNPLTTFNNCLGFLFFKEVLKVNLVKFFYAKIMHIATYRLRIFYNFTFLSDNQLFFVFYLIKGSFSNLDFMFFVRDEIAKQI